jgi:hypothetical protein
LVLPDAVLKENGQNGPQNEASQTAGDGHRSAISALKTEVVGFLLEGKKPGEILAIEDLDTVVTPSGQRLIPLLRLLKVLEMEMEEKGDIISFSPEGSLKIILDIQRKETQIKGQSRPISLVLGVSDITAKKDIYLSPEILAEILLMKIEWNEQDYRFAAKTDQRLKIWKGPAGGSLFGIQTKQIPTNLPELFPPAQPGDFTLDFMEFQIRPYFTTASAYGSPSRVGIDSPRQTFWGRSFGGRYRLQVSEPWVMWSDSSFQRGSGSAIMLNRGDWTYSLPDAEIAAGDSVFGLNDLTFPIVRMTGVRFNGVAGFPAEEDVWRPSPGMGNYFLPPRVVAGTAPVGSKVELIINDRSIETQEVLVGTYRFEEIRLVPGSLNAIRIVITEPSGYQRIIEENIFGRSIHLPQGGLAYLGGMGTNRQIYDWTTRGLFGGGRALYGVNDSLTLGTTWAAQNNFYIPLSMSSLESNGRQYPQASFHTGGQAAWLPFENLLLSGDISFSKGRGDQGAYDGMAYKIKGELYPSRRFQILSQFFHYGPDFFNGENIKLRDKEGYVLNGRWIINPKWLVSSNVGGVWDNLGNHSDNTLYVDFQNLEISSRMSSKMTIIGGANRISPNWEDGGPKTLYTLKVMATPFKDVNFDGFFSKGDYLDPAKQMDFFSGLRIPGLLLYRPPSVAANLRIPVKTGNVAGVAYWEDPNRKRPSVLHDFFSQGSPIRVHTELGYDVNYQKPFIDQRTEYLFDRWGTKFIGLNSRYERGDWTVSLIFTFSDLFSYSRGLTTRVSDSSISPDRGGVHGRVFIDCNANGRMDPDEPGVENVRVISDNINKTLTDKQGYFILPCWGQNKKSRLFLDLDTVPAIYSPTHAIQTAYLSPGSLTEVNFGITPLHSISGFMQAINPDKKIQPLSGVRIYLTNANDEKKIADSITAQDGSFYIGDIRPGRYYLQVDTATLSPKYIFQDHKMMVEILPKKEPQELSIHLWASFTDTEKSKAKEKLPGPVALKIAPPIKAAQMAPQEEQRGN